MKSKDAFSQTTFSQMQSAITDLHNRLASLDRYPVSNQTFLNMFVREDLHDAWSKVAETFETRHSSSDFYLPHPMYATPISLSLEVTNAKFLAVQNFKMQREPEDFIAWVNRRLDLGFRFGRVNRVLNLLNTKCATPRQVRYYWPPILTLAELGSVSVRDKEAMANPDGRRAPPLEPGLRRACQDTAALITAASLVEPKPRQELPMEITFNSWRNHQSRSEAGLGVYSIHMVT